jgi:hypothetical protein
VTAKIIAGAPYNDKVDIGLDALMKEMPLIHNKGGERNIVDCIHV